MLRAKLTAASSAAASNGKMLVEQRQELKQVSTIPSTNCHPQQNDAKLSCVSVPPRALPWACTTHASSTWHTFSADASDGDAMHPARLTSRPCMPGASRTAAAPARSGQAGGAHVAAEQGAGRARGTACGSQAGRVQPQGAEDRCRELAGRLSNVGVHAQLNLQHSGRRVQDSTAPIADVTKPGKTHLCQPSVRNAWHIARRNAGNTTEVHSHEASLNSSSTHAPAAAHQAAVGSPTYNSGGGRCVGSRPNRFFRMTRSRENLSSGEKRAGCAECVGVPSGAVFCACQSSSMKLGWQQLSQHTSPCACSTTNGSFDIDIVLLSVIQDFAPPKCTRACRHHPGST